MAGGSNQDSRIKNGAKKKGKLVLAKSPKELGLAVFVFLLFIANGIYQVVKYMQSQAPTTTTSQSAQTAAAGAHAAASSSSSPMGGIIIGVLLVVGLIGFAAYKFLLAGGASSSKGSGKSSGKKGKFMLAKSPKELALAGVVLVLFVGNGIYQIVKYMQSQAPSATTSQSAQTATAGAQAVASSSSSPMIGIIIGVLVVVGLVGFAAYKFLMAGVSSSSSGGGSNSSGGGGSSSSSSRSAKIPSGKKGKFMLAKSPKELALAGVVLVLFLGNGIYQIVKYMQSQAPSATTSQSAQTATAGAQAAASSSSSPMGGVIIGVLVIVGLIGFAAYKFLLAGGASSSKGSGKKGKFMLAKSPKELALAAVVLVLFLGNGIYQVVKYMQEQSPQSSPQQSNSQMAQQPGTNPENMNNQNPNNPNPAMNQDGTNMAQPGAPGQMGQQNNTLGNMPGAQAGSTSTQGSGDEISIIPRKNIKKSGKMVLISVGSSGRSNPFLPAAENSVPSHKIKTSLPYLPAPPEEALTNSDASKIMDTTISGILYDKFSPSAIINISGTDYLVKQGDIINKYKVLSITKSQVLVQLGANVYKAGVGELLSQTNLNYNTIANLNKKFGGNVRKKGY